MTIYFFPLKMVSVLEVSAWRIRSGGVRKNRNPVNRLARVVAAVEEARARRCPRDDVTIRSRDSAVEAVIARRRGRSWHRCRCSRATRRLAKSSSRRPRSCRGGRHRCASGRGTQPPSGIRYSNESVECLCCVFFCSPTPVTSQCFTLDSTLPTPARLCRCRYVAY